jgi:hypothetical protein
MTQAPPPSTRRPADAHALSAESSPPPDSRSPLEPCMGWTVLILESTDAGEPNAELNVQVRSDLVLIWEGHLTRAVADRARLARWLWSAHLPDHDLHLDDLYFSNEPSCEPSDHSDPGRLAVQVDGHRTYHVEQDSLAALVRLLGTPSPHDRSGPMRPALAASRSPIWKSPSSISAGRWTN